MNKKQIIALWCGIIIIVGMMIFPPWKYTYEVPNKTKLEQPGPYNTIFTPPAVPVSYAQDTYKFFHGEFQSKWTPRVDVIRLTIQCIAGLIITLGLVVTFKRSNKDIDK